MIFMHNAMRELRATAACRPPDRESSLAYCLGGHIWEAKCKLAVMLGFEHSWNAFAEPDVGILVGPNAA